MEASDRFEVMYRAHCGAVRTFVHRRMAPTGADDVVADVFLAAWRAQVPGLPAPPPAD